mgnify:CR=1 FL=1
MTAWQTGAKMSKIAQSRGKRTDLSGRKKEKSKKANNFANRRFFQFLVCCILFLTLTAAKLLLPSRTESVRNSVSALLNQNMDVTQVFSAIGRAFSGSEDVRETLSDVYQAVFHSQESTAVAAAAAAVPEPEGSSQLLSLRAFAMGEGNCAGWLPAVPAEAQSEEPDSSADEETEAARTAAVSSEQAESVQLSCVQYSQKDLPDHVEMEQEILGFDYCTPVVGTLSSGFGYRDHPVDGEERFHYGIDIAADTGTEIDCFADGVVTAVGVSSSYGNYLIISHDGGFSTLYAHCSRILAHAAQSVREGEKIAEVGETGLATGPHLHFELHADQEYLNPIYYVSLV